MKNALIVSGVVLLILVGISIYIKSKNTQDNKKETEESQENEVTGWGIFNGMKDFFARMQREEEEEETEESQNSGGQDGGVSQNSEIIEDQSGLA
jgi:hypothetical protein